MSCSEVRKSADQGQSIFSFMTANKTLFRIKWAIATALDSLLGRSPCVSAGALF
jgi:hypothetical protein